MWKNVILNSWVDDYRDNKAACSSDTCGNIQIWHLNQDVLHLQRSVRLLRYGNNAWNTKRPARKVQLNKANMSANVPGYKEPQWAAWWNAAVFSACTKQCSHYHGTQRPEQNLPMFWQKCLANCARFKELACNKFYPLGLRTIDAPLQLELSGFLQLISLRLFSLTWWFGLMPFLKTVFLMITSSYFFLEVPCG